MLYTHVLALRSFVPRVKTRTYWLVGLLIVIYLGIAYAERRRLFWKVFDSDTAPPLALWIKRCVLDIGGAFYQDNIGPSSYHISGVLLSFASALVAVLAFWASGARRYTAFAWTTTWAAIYGCSRLLDYADGPFSLALPWTKPAALFVMEAFLIWCGYRIFAAIRVNVPSEDAVILNIRNSRWQFTIVAVLRWTAAVGFVLAFTRYVNHWRWMIAEAGTCAAVAWLTLRPLTAHRRWAAWAAAIVLPPLIGPALIIGAEVYKYGFDHIAHMIQFPQMVNTVQYLQFSSWMILHAAAVGMLLRTFGLVPTRTVVDGVFPAPLNDAYATISQNVDSTIDEARRERLG